MHYKGFLLLSLGIPHGDFLPTDIMSDGYVVVPGPYLEDGLTVFHEGLYYSFYMQKYHIKYTEGWPFILALWFILHNYTIFGMPRLCGQFARSGT